MRRLILSEGVETILVPSKPVVILATGVEPRVHASSHIIDYSEDITEFSITCVIKQYQQYLFSGAPTNRISFDICSCDD